MQQDSALVSLLIGRYGAAIWGLVALVLGKYGITFTDAETSQIMAAASAVLSIALVVVSKVREKRKSQAAGEPPSLLKNTGGTKLVTVAAILWLCIVGVSASIILQGCIGINPVIKQDAGQRLAVSIGAKALGQKMQGRFEWSPQFDTFTMMLEQDGITLESGKMLTNYVMPRIPELYHREASILLDSIGFEFNGDHLVSVAKVDKSLLLEAIGAFKEGLLYHG